MIQRVQSIYFLLAALALYALFLFPLVHNVYTADGKPVTISVTGVFQDNGGQMAHTQFFVGLTIATAVVGIIPLIIIFLYKNRKQQIALSYSAIFVIIGLTAWMEHSVETIVNHTTIQISNFGIGVLLSCVSILFLVMGIKAIQRDEKLIKSADRLR